MAAFQWGDDALYTAAIAGLGTLSMTRSALKYFFKFP